MTRILADLPYEDIRWLDQRAAEQGKSPLTRRRGVVLSRIVRCYAAKLEAEHENPDRNT